MTDERPDPDRLLQAIRDDEAAGARGKLKIFFGACAGVGKTYAMLQAARLKQSEGVDLIIGVVETHARAETEAQLQDLQRLPLREIAYKGRTLQEFDLDGVLARKPQLVIVDELAHTNAEGSRHAKRWQDVEELLSAGIDVYTTLNVQHLESLNDIVASITGVQVRETLPDKVFDSADEVTLVDLPHDELLARLKAGKVYLAEQAVRAAKNFFRTGNLIALRELALRRTADRVDAQMRAYRVNWAIGNVWQAKERLLVCVGPRGQGDKLVRAGARLAQALQADWICVHVETPSTQRLPAARRARVMEVLKLAESLGAETATLAGADVATTLAAYARSRNAGRLLVGRTRGGAGWRRYKPSLAARLAQEAGDLDISSIATDQAATPATAVASVRRVAGWQSYLWATLACGLATAVAAGLVHIFDPANVIMLLLLTVVLVALRLGRGPGAWAAFLSVLCFDFFFVAPRFSVSVSDSQYLFTFLMMLMVALGIGQLAARLRFEADAALARERRTAALAVLARELSGALVTEQIVEIAERHVSGMFDAEVCLLLPDSAEGMVVSGSPTLMTPDISVAQWVYDHQQPAGMGTATLPAALALYLPLKAPMRTRGVLGVRPRQARMLDEPEMMRLLDTFGSQVALALERVHYVDVARDAVVHIEGERLRNSLLSAMSHDLRSPLTVLVGLASTLVQQESQSREHRELASTILETATRMSGLVSNLLEMARLQTAGVTLNKDWQSLEEVVGSVLRQMEAVLAGHQVRTELPPDLPLCQFDPVLIERVLANLLDNAAKYTAPGSHIVIAARAESHQLTISVEDDGAGLPVGQEDTLFQKFNRGVQESHVPGAGLGLAICRAIVEAHGGNIRAERVVPLGARFVFTLPLADAPMPDTQT